LEDTKGVTNSRTSKDRQYNDQYKKSKGQTMIDKENLRLNSKTPLKTGDMNLGAPKR